MDAESRKIGVLKVFSSAPKSCPKDGLRGLIENWRADSLAGFVVFLIALPLCLGIAMASGFPPMAGVIAAVVGGLVVTHGHGSYINITGPAAGLIVVMYATVETLGGGVEGYQSAQAAVVVAGIILAILGLLKAGNLGSFFPSSVVHGMLASIGIIIMAKQVHVMLGVSPRAQEAIPLIKEIPHSLLHMNPELAAIGLATLLILIAHSLCQGGILKLVPAPLLALIVAILMGKFFDLGSPHSYFLLNCPFQIDPHKALVQLPSNALEAISVPDFSKIGQLNFWSCVFSICLVQGIETLLSASAIERLDPFKRHCNLSKDLSAVGIGSAISGAIGGLPLISEIVRSSANISAGARTRYSNFFHGAFLLAAVVLVPMLIQMIPLSCLAALLVFTGFRLASPRVFKQTHELGAEQLLIFTITILATLQTDLLIGVACGILAKTLLHILNGVHCNNLFVAKIQTENLPGGICRIKIEGAAIFLNYLSIAGQLSKIEKGLKIQIDMSDSEFVDHTVMDRLQQFARDYEEDGGSVQIIGLDTHHPLSKHPLAARRACGHEHRFRSH